MADGNEAGMRCSCRCIRDRTHLEPAEWEQDPFCPEHPDVNGQIGMIQWAWSRLDAEPKKRLADALAALLARSARVVEPESEPVPSPAPVTDLPEGYVRLPSGAVVADVGAKCAVGWEFFTGDPIDVRWEPMDDAAGPVSSQFPIAVRPASPVTEQVRWQDAIGRTLPDWREVFGAVDENASGWSLGGSDVSFAFEDEENHRYKWLAAPVDPSGCVTVLAEDGK